MEVHPEHIDRTEALKRLTAPGQPYQLEKIVHYGQPCWAFKNAPPTLRHLFEEARSDLPFLIYGEERLSFEEAWQQARQQPFAPTENGVVPHLVPIRIF